MDTDKEPKSEETPSGQDADAKSVSEVSSHGHGSGFLSGLRHRIERYTDSKDPKYRFDSKRRLARKVWRFLKYQLSDARQAYKDLQARINKEVSTSDSASRSRRPQVTAPLSSRDGRSSSPPIRPMGLPEAGSSKSGGSKIRRVLVVGGMNFFGAALVRQLNRRGVHDIVVADGLEAGQWKSLPSLRFEEFLSISELSRSLGSRAQNLGNFSHVFYLGGWDDTEAPLALPKALLAMVQEHGGRLVTLSSACSLGPNPDAKDIRTGRAEGFLPETRAGVMACLFDRYAFARLMPRSFLSLKHHRLYGSGELADDSIYGLAKSVFQQVSDHGLVALSEALRPGTEEGNRKHDFLSVTSAAQIAVYLAESEDTSGVYELGSGSGHTASEFVTAVLAAMECKQAVEWKGIPFSPASPQPEVADVARLREVGWTREEPSLEEGIRRYVKGCLQDGHVFEEEEIKSGESPEPEKPAAAQGSATARIFPSRRKPFPSKTAA